MIKLEAEGTLAQELCFRSSKTFVIHLYHKVRGIFHPWLLSWLVFTAAFSTTAETASYLIPEKETDLIGELMLVTAGEEETLLDIARAHGIGQEEILLANPAVDRWLPAAGTPVLIPNQYLLPTAPRSGLVLNLPEMRIYHFLPTPQGAVEVITYPVSIGRMDWKTPLGTARIVRKQKDPAWHPPASVKQEAADAGESIPDVIPPGPDNPLGKYALRLSLPGYLIHGTNKPFGVGMRVTHGCVRLLPEDIEELFGRIEVGTEVHLVNQPVKLGWDNGTLYLEVHPPMDEDIAAATDLLQHTLELIYTELEHRPARLLGREITRAVRETTGIPLAISAHSQNPPIQTN